MNILTHLSTTLWLFAVLDVAVCGPTSDQGVEERHEEEITSSNPATVDPLVLIYHDGFDFSIAIDIQTLRNIHFTTSPLRNPSEIVFLCPAESEYELNIQLRYGYVDPLLFVKNTFTSVDSINEIKCSNRFEPLRKWFYIEVQMGFRFYAKDGTLSEKMIRTLNNENQDPDIYWLSFLLIRTESTGKMMDASTLHVVMAKMHSNDYAEECADYTYGLYDGIAPVLENYYARVNQNKVFKTFEISQSLPYGYLVLHQLAPLQDNINTVIKPAFCTRSNTVPIWQKVAEGSLRKVEEFIRKVADVIGYVTVDTRAEGELSLPIHNGREWEKIYLQLDKHHKKIFVPRVIRKKLFYKIASATHESDEEDSYSLIIYVHNEPTDQMEKYCEENLCIKNGWPFDIETVDIGITYCCLDPFFVDNPFNLNSIPIMSDDGTIKRISVVEALKNEHVSLNLEKDDAEKRIRTE